MGYLRAVRINETLLSPWVPAVDGRKLHGVIHTMLPYFPGIWYVRTCRVCIISSSIPIQDDVHLELGGQKLTSWRLGGELRILTSGGAKKWKVVRRAFE